MTDKLTEAHSPLPPPDACPFCGGCPVSENHPAHTHALATFMPDHPGSVTIECAKCGAGLIGETYAEVVSRWNTRSPSHAALLAENERLRNLLSIIVGNARLHSDPTMGNLTDIYLVPLDDIRDACPALSPAPASEQSLPQSNGGQG